MQKITVYTKGLFGNKVKFVLSADSIENLIASSGQPVVWSGLERNPDNHEDVRLKWQYTPIAGELVVLEVDS